MKTHRPAGQKDSQFGEIGNRSGNNLVKTEFFFQKVLKIVMN